MRTHLTTFGFAAILSLVTGGAASAGITLSAPGTGTMTIPSGTTQTIATGKFYAYRVLGVYNYQQVTSGPWSKVDSNGVLGNPKNNGNGNGGFLALPTGAIASDLSVSINGQKIGATNAISTNKLSGLVNNLNDLTLNQTIIDSTVSEGKPVAITVANTLASQCDLNGRIGIKAVYIPNRLNAKGSINVPNLIMEGEYLTVKWQLVREGMIDTFDPGPMPSGGASTESPVSPGTGQGGVTGTDGSTVGKENIVGGNGNNGHGNNGDGVDVSNPGQGLGGPNGIVDPSGAIDDEVHANNGNNN